MTGTSTASLVGRLGALLAAVSIGVLVAGQAVVNGDLGTVVGDGLTAAVLSFIVGLGSVTLVVLGTSRRQLLRSFTAQVRARAVPWWQLGGGFFGAVLVTSQGAIEPRIGVALYSTGLVAGAAAGSLVADVRGVGPAGAQPLTFPRLVGAVGAIVGVAVAARGSSAVESAGDGVMVALTMVAVVLIGAGTAFQTALNGQVARISGDPLVATCVNFVIGLTLLTFSWLVLWLTGVVTPAAPPAPWHNPLIWTGGVIGVIFIAIASTIVRSLGVLVLGLANVVGQLLGSVVITVLLPSDGHTLSRGVYAGIIVTVIAVAIGSIRPRVRLKPVQPES